MCVYTYIYIYIYIHIYTGITLSICLCSTRRGLLWSGWNGPAWCSGGKRPLIAGCSSLQRLDLLHLRADPSAN